MLVIKSPIKKYVLLTRIITIIFLLILSYTYYRLYSKGDFNGQTLLFLRAILLCCK